MDSSDSYDAVVIGSGPGGLTTAAAIARAGKRVLVLERHFALGGNAQTFRRNKRFDFDVGVHTVDDCGPEGAVPRILRDVGAEVAFNELDPDGFDVLCFEDGRFSVPASWEAYRVRLIQSFAAQAAAIEGYLDYLLSVVGRINMGRSFTRLLLLKRPANLIQPLLRSDPGYFERLRGRPGGDTAAQVEGALGKDLGQLTLAEVFDHFGFDNALRHVLGGQNLLYGTCWTAASVAMHAVVLDRYLRGGFYPRGGSAALVSALVRAIEDGGGEVRTRQEVRRILVDKDGVQGVQLASDEVIRAEVVISNADSRRTLRDLVDRERLEPALRERAESARMATPLFVIYLATQTEPASLGLTNANYWLFPRRNLEQQYAACAAGQLPEDPMVYVSIASLKDPDNGDIAPAGHTNLQLMALAPAAAAAWGDGGSVSAPGRYRHGDGYTSAKQCFEQRMLDVVRRMMPELLENVVWQESATPLTQQRFTGCSGGTGYGLDHTPDQFLTGRLPIVTPIRGLYLAGASTVFAHGLTGALLSGRACAQSVLGQLG